jgi:hypothetical protein
MESRDDTHSATCKRVALLAERDRGASMKIRIVRVILLCAVLAVGAYAATHYGEIATKLLGPQVQETCNEVRTSDSVQHVCTFTKRW